MSCIKDKCNGAMKYRVGFLAPIFYQWHKAYPQLPKDQIKSYRFTHCPNTCGNLIVRNAQCVTDCCGDVAKMKNAIRKSRKKKSRGCSGRKVGISGNGAAGLGKDCFAAEQTKHANAVHENTENSYGKPILFPNFYQNWEMCQNPGYVYN